MKKLAVLVVSVLGLVLFFSSAAGVSASSGPVGGNGLRAFAGPGVGQVTLEWSRVSLSGENYSIRYGTSSGSYQFIAPYVGYISTYTIGALTPGQTYYFALERFWTGNVSMGWDGEVSMVAPSGASMPAVGSGPIGRNLLSVVVSGSGQVTLNWRQFFPDTNGWHIVYGPGPGVYQWGVLNAVTTAAGVTDYSFNVGALPHGQMIYFALVPIRNGQAQYITSEVSVFVP